MKKPTKVPGREEALVAMAALCAKCEQCEADLRDKMRRKGVTAADADYVIDYLNQNYFLNENRFAEAYVADKHRFNGWGRIKLRMMLAAKHVSRDAVDQAIATISDEEYMATLIRQLRVKARDMELSDAMVRQKLLRSMYTRGYEPALTSLAIRRLREEQRQ